MTNTEKRELLIKELLSVKAKGLRVFTNVPSEYNYSNYGLLTDGTNIIYVQFGEYGSTLFTTFFEWIPSKKNGSGCRTLKNGYGYKELTKEVFLEAVEYGKKFAKQCRAELYKDFDSYFNRDNYNKNHYIEL